MKKKTKFQIACDKVTGKPCLYCSKIIEDPFLLGRRVFCSYQCTQNYQFQNQDVTGGLTDDSDENIWKLPERF